MNDKVTPGRTFYDEQIAYLEAGDVDGLMTQYHDDAVLIAFEFTIHGRKAIHEHMRRYLQQLGRIKLKSTDKFTETDDSIFFEATIETAAAEAKVYDVFMLRDGKATHQFTGRISVTPFSSST